MRTRQYVAGRGSQHLVDQPIASVADAELVESHGPFAVYQVGRYAVYVYDGIVITSYTRIEHALGDLHTRSYLWQRTPAAA
jgi:hypothetical protein